LLYVVHVQLATRCLVMPLSLFIGGIVCFSSSYTCRCDRACLVFIRRVSTNRCVCFVCPNLRSSTSVQGVAYSQVVYVQCMHIYSDLATVLSFDLSVKREPPKAGGQRCCRLCGVADRAYYVTVVVDCVVVDCVRTKCSVTFVIGVRT